MVCIIYYAMYELMFAMCELLQKELSYHDALTAARAVCRRGRLMIERARRRRPSTAGSFLRILRLPPKDDDASLYFRISRAWRRDYCPQLCSTDYAVLLKRSLRLYPNVNQLVIRRPKLWRSREAEADQAALVQASRRTSRQLSRRERHS